MTRIAIVQKAPAFLDRAECLRIAVSAVAEAAAGGARLVIFPEAFIPGYPAWIWRLRPGGDLALSERLHRALLENAVDLARDDLGPLREAAREHGVMVVCGINERDGAFSRGSLYNTVVTLGSDGSVLNRHRKLMPTNPERMVWGQGDATGLRTVDSPCGRIGALICWENYMPLVRYALYAQGLDVYIAPTYDSGDRWIATLQHIARESGCWVLGSGVAFRGADIRGAAPGMSDLYPVAEEWVNAGDSAVIAPGGKIVAGPLRNEVGVLYADINREPIDNARRTLDVTGHYARPDLFSLHVRTGPLNPVDLDGSVRWPTEQVPGRIHIAHRTNDEEMAMSLDRATKQKGFNRDAVDAVEEAIGVVVDPAPPEKQRDAIEPGSEDGLRRGKPRARGLPARKQKRTPFL